MQKTVWETAVAYFNEYEEKRRTLKKLAENRKKQKRQNRNIERKRNCNEGWPLKKLPRADRRIVKIKTYRKTESRMENYRLDCSRKFVLNGKNLNINRRELPEHAGTGGTRRIRHDRQRHAGKNSGGNRLDRKEQEERAGSGWPGKNTQEKAEYAGTCRNRRKMQDQNGQAGPRRNMNMLEKPEQLRNRKENA